LLRRQHDTRRTDRSCPQISEISAAPMNVKDFQRLVFMIKSIYPEDRRCISEVCSARIVVGRRADFAKVLPLRTGSTCPGYVLRKSWGCQYSHACQFKSFIFLALAIQKESGSCDLPTCFQAS
ncbi:hypothetical protein KCU59_g137, partial [Aureobasidium melanogenum]